MKYLLFFLSTTFLFGQSETENLYQKKTFQSGDDILNYRIMYPQNFDASVKYPVVLFLHGSGERGNDNELQLVHGSSLFADPKVREDYPAIVVFPQCPTDDSWANVTRNDNQVEGSFTYDYSKPIKKPSELVMKLLDELLANPYVDQNRIYITGLSMGGMGTFELLYRFPDKFAAAIPICGGSNPESAKAYANKVPVWIIHGAKDKVVSPAGSLEMAKRILAAGGYPKVTIFEDANHNSWDPAFAHPEYLKWMFSHSK
ncbi:carboxylesterase family protein [Marinigracilibium pacificum]|uniref:Prolyl oligopeptidase family serine peptidase n=1 Tax=Marinigracilibium pacificum TaxID=2729599 RepID=A0A848J1Z5_9BACT|nr:prolyl oligopeptidase family serine peptidase [Marinigracilibium pacificum]NMM48494.1 prolyl oligopeptidase family serine peptidase [Marinigracilibium pacificum]